MWGVPLKLKSIYKYTVDRVNFAVTLFSLYSRIENISENYILENFCIHNKENQIMRSQHQATALLCMAIARMALYHPLQVNSQTLRSFIS